ncbi:M13 family metallopeptidase [Caulobacter sp. KR2-114]|uniref:M13 family metallopeptidase n=1 Tax=Caulobacter sp. KR2-114 TaxID=3400912 RepID=UPI003C00D830
MKKLFLSAAAVAILAGAVAHADDAGLAPQRQGAWGFDLAGRDTAVSPGKDFYDYANGAYEKALVIPADRTRYGAFDALAALSEDRVKAVLETAAATPNATGDQARVANFYKAFMDEGRIEALGARPLAADLRAIRAAKGREGIARLMGQANASFLSSVFQVGIGTDAKDPVHYAVYVDQAGLGLPDRDYYLEPKFAETKAKYEAYVAQMLQMAGWPDAKGQAKAIVAMETRIAQASWSKAEQRDPVKSYHPMSPAELAAAAPGFPWQAWLAGADLGGVKRVIVGEDSAFPKLAKVFADTPVETLRAWLAFNAADNAAPYLSKSFVDANFAFRAKTLGGQPQQKLRWKRAVATLNGDIGEAVGRLYVAAYFPPEAKAKMEALVGDLRAAMKARIEHVSWMSEATRAKALEKLSKFGVKIGYPNKWRDYSALTVTADDLYGDVRRSAAFEWNRQVKRLYQPVDKSEWGMTPQTVNAYYSPTENEIVFPAAILQPPFFDPNADMAINYGAIGGVIGHEMTHGFDDQGRQYAGDGSLTDWWTAEDAAKFKVQADKLGAQYSAFEPLPGLHVNGELTMGENIADLGGVLLALDAYHASLKGQPAPVVDGLTGDQRVFLGWAQVWRGAARDETTKRLLVVDPHSPPKARVDIPFRNVDAWYDAWGVKPGDPAYLPPEQRVRIW